MGARISNSSNSILDGHVLKQQEEPESADFGEILSPEDKSM